MFSLSLSLHPPPLSSTTPKKHSSVLRKRVVDAVKDGEDAQRVRERVVKVQQRAHQDALREVAAEDLENHPDDVEHRRLHGVEAHEVVEFLVADDAEVDEEEDNEGRELRRVVVGGKGPWLWLVLLLFLKRFWSFFFL